MKHFLFAFILIALSLQLYSTNDNKVSLKPTKTETAPIIDGDLSDEIWQKAITVTGFKTFIPDFGKDVDEKTIAYMAYDEDNLYFAFKCFDGDPSKIKHL